jgi:hypothetical protein
VGELGVAECCEFILVECEVGPFLNSAGEEGTVFGGL